MPTIGKNNLVYPNTSDEPNVPGDLQKLATSADTAIGGGMQLFDTLADLKALPASLCFEGKHAVVTKDTLANNGDYVYTGGVWARPYAPVVLWTGNSGKTDTLTLSLPVTGFSELIVEGTDDDKYLRSFHIRAENGATTLQFVGANLTIGNMFGKAVFISITDTVFKITAQRIHQMEGSTSDNQCLYITRILGIR